MTDEDASVFPAAQECPNAAWLRPSAQVAVARCRCRSAMAGEAEIGTTARETVGGGGRVTPGARQLAGGRRPGARPIAPSRTRQPRQASCAGSTARPAVAPRAVAVASAGEIGGALGCPAARRAPRPVSSTAAGRCHAPAPTRGREGPARAALPAPPRPGDRGLAREPVQCRAAQIVGSRGGLVAEPTTFALGASRAGAGRTGCRPASRPFLQRPARRTIAQTRREAGAVGSGCGRAQRSTAPDRPAHLGGLRRSGAGPADPGRRSERRHAVRVAFLQVVSASKRAGGVRRSSARARLDARPRAHRATPAGVRGRSTRRYATRQSAAAAHRRAPRASRSAVAETDHRAAREGAEERPPSGPRRCTRATAHRPVQQEEPARAMATPAAMAVSQYPMPAPAPELDVLRARLLTACLALIGLG